MKVTKHRQLTAVFDIDLVAFLVYSGVKIENVADEAGRVAFLFPSAAVSEKQRELASGSARVEVTRWSSTIRQLHANFLTPSAKSALRSRLR